MFVQTKATSYYHWIINKEHVQIDPQLLFQRLLVAVAANKFMDLPDLFKYELCSYPAALFETTFVPRQADKPVLADALWNEVKPEQISQPSQPLYVFDRGALSHGVWRQGERQFGGLATSTILQKDS